MSQKLSPFEQYLSDKLANELRYAGSQLGKGNIPYVGKPRFSPEQMRGLTAPGLGSGGNPTSFTKGQQRPDGKFYTGSAYEWQSGPSAARAGLLGTEVVGDAAFAPSFMGPPIPNRIANAPVPLTLPSPATAPTTGLGVAASPAERAYQSAKTEAAAMVATDPLMQQWNAAQKAKDYATADQLGQQIWQQKYGGTPMGQPGGATGAFNPLMQKTFGYQAGMSPTQIAQTITNPSAIPVGPGEAPYQIGDLGTRATADTGYDPAAYGVTPEMIEKLKNQALSQARK